MLDSNRNIASIQSSRGAKMQSDDTAVIERDEEYALKECRNWLQENQSSYRNLKGDKKKAAIQDCISNFVLTRKPRIRGYIDDSGALDTTKLTDYLVNEITDYGILADAMRDESVFEIRVNGSEIKVEKNGRVQDLTDNKGNVISFESVEQQETVFRKLMGDVRLTPKDAVMNARTIEGYRIAAVHSSATSPDPLNPSAPMYHSMVLRKFKQSKMGLPEIVRFKTLSDGMGKLLSLLPAGGLTFATVGPTASGKTTTNNAILQAVPPTTRTVLLQNPSEIDLRFRDASGRVYNDVLHLEAKECENPEPSDPTMENLMAHILRLSPTFVCFGELRTNKEFKLGMQIAQAGHPINCTYHSESSKGAVRRFLTAYCAESGNEPAHLALEMLTSLLDIIIVQKIMKDGSRRILQISEVIGVDPKNENQPLINDLYIFETTGEPEYDDAGNVKNIVGRHKRVGKISDRMINKLKLEGVKSEMFEFLTKEPSEDEVETYTGEF